MNFAKSRSQVARIQGRFAVRRTSAMVVAATAVVLFSLFALAGVADAAMPWWHVNVVSAPASVSGSEGRVVLEVSDLGDAAVDGEVSPVSIVDRLPAGVVPTHVYGEGGGSFPIGINGVREIIKCAVAGQVVSCSYNGPLLDYERFMVAVGVQVAPGAGDGTNETTVTGGGAPRVARSVPLRLEAGGGFGGQSYELTAEGEAGEPVAQAGAHPFQLTSTFTLASRAVPVTKHESSKEVEVLPEVQPVALAKDLRFSLPQGLFGNPTPLQKCPLAVFLKSSNTSQCPDDTVVGVATTILTDLYEPERAPFGSTFALYSLEPNVGEPARFGFKTQAGPIILDTAVPAAGGEYPVVVSAPDIPDNFGVIGAQVTFWGVPALAAHDNARGSCLDQFEGKDIHNVTQLESFCPVQEKAVPFLDLPTSCEAAPHTIVQGDPWEAVGMFTTLGEYTFADEFGQPLAQDGCNKLSFEPSMSVTPDSRKASVPSGLTVDVHVSQQAALDPGGLAEGTVRNTTVTLPAGVGLNPSSADGLQSCALLSGSGPQQEAAEEQGQLDGINLDSSARADCPEASKVGLVEIDTPLLPNPLKGAVYLAAQEANPFGSVLALYMEVHDPISGVRVKLAGEVVPCAAAGEDPHSAAGVAIAGVVCQAPGQLVTTFENTPQLPFEDLKLEFFGGSRAPLGTPAVCGSYVTSAQITPWSSTTPDVLASPPFEINSDAAGGQQCHNPLPFAPELAAGATNLQAGAFTPFTTTMSREDTNQNLDALQIHLPVGMSGLLTGVELCPEAKANQGLCGPNSLIGETTVSVGLGSQPYTVAGGKVYLTGPYAGAPFGLSIVNPAKAGPFDLAATKNNHPACDCVLVRAKVEVNPVTAAITVTSDSTGAYKIPTILEGIPLQIKHVNVTINRPGFTFNPTNCEPLKITGTLTSAEGATSTLSEPFQATNCATLAFKPGFAVSTSGHTSRANGASLHVKLTYPKAPFGTQTNIKSVKVDLPRQLPSRLSTLQKACPDNVFEANPAACPSASRVATARAITPLIPVPLEGPGYFVSHGGAKFPELIVVLQGYGVTLDLHGETFISKTGITSSTFRTVPDAPVGSFELTLPEGTDSALAANGNLCSATLTMPTAFLAQNGDELHESTPIEVTGCKPAIKLVSHHVKGATVTIVASVPSAGKLSFSGKGLGGASKSTAKAGTLTATLKLTHAEQRLLKAHPGRKLSVSVTLRFKPKRGAGLTNHVTVLVG